MSKRMIKLLEKIKLGKIKSLQGIKMTLEEFLEKDENGISVLEHLIMNNIFIDSENFERIKHSAEVGYIYCKNGQYLYYFEFTEEDLFSIISDKLFIEFISEKEKLNGQIIKSVKNHFEIIDIIIKHNKSFEYYKLSYLSEELVQKLITKDSNGVYPIEKYLNNRDVYRHLIPLVNDYNILVELCKKYNNVKWLKYVNKDVLMIIVSEYEIILKLLVNKFNIVPDILKNLPEDIDFINFLRKNNYYEYLKSAEINVLLLKIDGDKTLLDELVEMGYKFEHLVVNNQEFICLLNKKSKLELLNEMYISERILLMSSKEVLKTDDKSDRTLLEYLLDNGCEPLKAHYCLDNPELIRILFNKGYYEVLGEKLREKQLLIEIEPGVLIIDKLLEKNIDIKIKFFTSVELAKKLYQRNRIDLLAMGNFNTLLINCDENNTYFDVVLEGIKARKIKRNLNDYYIYKNLAQFYYFIAKHDMMEYIEELKVETLLKKYNDKTLIEELLDLDVNLTVNKILSKKTRANDKISIILKSYGIDTQNVDIITDKPNFTNDYLDDINSTFGIGPLYYEGEFLIKKIEELFMSDGKSNSELIVALLSGYRNALINNYEIAIQELRMLLQIKQKNVDSFFYIKEKDSGYFSMATGSVHCDDAIISTLLHETGHALHYYLVNFKIPEEYDEIIERVRQDPKTLSKVENYSEKFSELYNKIEIIVSKKCDEYFELHSKEEDEEITNFLAKSKEERKEEFKELGILEEDLNIILDGIFTKEEYISHKKRIFVKENVDATLRSEFGAYISIGDLIDAIYDGSFKSGVLENELGERLKPAYGHGISYYYASDHGFDEMFANFCMILKSKDCNQALELLHEILGDELYNMLNDFYYTNILNFDGLKLDEKKVL